MAGIGIAIIALALAIGIGTGIGVAIHDKKTHHKHHDYQERSLPENTQSVLFHFSDASLRGHDLACLRDLRMDMLSADTALFSGHCRGRDWEAEGNVTLPLEPTKEGLMCGGLRIPGLAFAPEITANGTWIAVNQSNADQETADAFENKIAEVHKQRLH